MDAWVVEALRVGYRIPFDRLPPLSKRPLSLPAYSPQSIRGVALNQELQNLLRKGAVEPAPQSPGFYSRLFLVQKASGSWRPIIDLSTLNGFITSSRFHMETPRSVLNSIRPGDWMISLDLQDAYLQVPVHHDSLRGRREAFPVQGPLLRSYDRASSLHEDYGTSVRHSPQERGQDASLPGRLAHPGLFKDRLYSVKGQAPISLYRTWHPGQPHEVVSSSRSVSSVHRHGDPFSAFYCSSHTSTSQQSHSTDRGVPINPVSSSVPLVSPSRPPVFPDSTRLRRNDQDEGPPTLPQGPVGPTGRPVPSLLVPSLSRGPSLVVERGSAERGSESLPSSSRHQLLLGRFGCRLGSPSRRTPRLGPLASPSEGSLYQHERASSSSARPAGLRTSAYGHVGSTVLRQHHHSSLPSSFGRDILVRSERHSKGGSPLGGESPHSSPSPVHHGVVKYLRRAARSASFIPSRLFVSPRNPERSMSKNAMSFYLRQLIVDSGAVSSAHPPRAHDIRGIATSLNYYSNLSLSNLMQVATWRSNRFFASRYLKEVSATQDNIQQFGPLVIAGDWLKPKAPQRKHRF